MAEKYNLETSELLEFSMSVNFKFPTSTIKEDWKSPKKLPHGVEKLFFKKPDASFLMKDLVDDGNNLSKKQRNKILADSSGDNMALNVPYSMNRRKRWEINSASELMDSNFERTDIACTAIDSLYNYGLTEQSKREFIRVRHKFDNNDNIVSVSTKSHRGNISKKIVDKPVELEYTLSKPHYVNKIYAGNMVKNNKKGPSTTKRKQLNLKDYADILDNFSTIDSNEQNQYDEEGSPSNKPRSHSYSLSDFIQPETSKTTLNKKVVNRHPKYHFDDTDNKIDVPSTNFKPSLSLASKIKYGPFETFNIPCYILGIKNQDQWLQLTEIFTKNGGYQFQWLNFQKISFQLNIIQPKTTLLVITVSQRDWQRKYHKDHKIEILVNGTNDVKLDTTDLLNFIYYQEIVDQPETFGLEMMIKEVVRCVEMTTDSSMFSESIKHKGRKNQIIVSAYEKVFLKVYKNNLLNYKTWPMHFGLQGFVFGILKCVTIEEHQQRSVSDDCFASSLAETVKPINEITRNKQNSSMENVAEKTLSSKNLSMKTIDEVVATPEDLSMKSVDEINNATKNSLMKVVDENINSACSKDSFDYVDLNDCKLDNKLNLDQSSTISSTLEHNNKKPEITAPLSCLNYHNQQNSTIITSSCGHSYCSDCLKKHFHAVIDEKRTHLLCPNDNCTKEYKLSLLGSFIQMELVKLAIETKFENLAKLKSYEIFICPNGCEIGFYKDTKKFNQVVCHKCSVHFCLKCKDKPHWPMDCEQAKFWVDKIEAQQKTDKDSEPYWIVWHGTLEQITPEKQPNVILTDYRNVIKKARNKRCDKNASNTFRKILNKNVEYKIKKKVEDNLQTAFQLIENGFAWLYMNRQIDNRHPNWYRIKVALIDLIEEENNLQRIVYFNTTIDQAVLIQQNQILINNIENFVNSINYDCNSCE